MTGGVNPSSYTGMSFMAKEEGNGIPVLEQVSVQLDSKGSDERVLALSCGSSSLAGSSLSTSSPTTLSSSGIVESMATYPSSAGCRALPSLFGDSMLMSRGRACE